MHDGHESNGRGRVVVRAKGPDRSTDHRDNGNGSEVVRHVRHPRQVSERDRVRRSFDDGHGGGRTDRQQDALNSVRSDGPLNQCRRRDTGLWLRVCGAVVSVRGSVASWAPEDERVRVPDPPAAKASRALRCEAETSHDCRFPAPIPRGFSLSLNTRRCFRLIYNLSLKSRFSSGSPR